VPVVKGEVHEEDAPGYLDPERQVDQVRNPKEWLSAHNAPPGRGPHRQHPGEEAQAGEAPFTT